ADVLVSASDANSMSLFLGTSSGFAPPTDWLAAHGAYEMVLADAEGDGFPDVAVGGGYGGSLVLHHNGPGSALIAGAPAPGDLKGGQLVTLTLQPAALELPAPQVSFGGVAAQVVTSGPGFVQVLAPAVDEPPGGAVDVQVSSGSLTLGRSAAFTWTPSLQASVT